MPSAKSILVIAVSLSLAACKSGLSDPRTDFGCSSTADSTGSRFGSGPVLETGTNQKVGTASLVVAGTDTGQSGSGVGTLVLATDAVTGTRVYRRALAKNSLRLDSAGAAGCCARGELAGGRDVRK